MREFVVSDAPLERVAALARATVEEAGGVVAQHTATTTEFDELVVEEGDWAREGYVGTYQNYGEDPVRLRVRVWASTPRSLFHWTAFLGLVQAVVFFSMSLAGLPPSANVWILTALVTFAALAVATIMYASSWAESADLEDELARRLTSRIGEDDRIPGEVYTLGEWEEHREAVIERAVEEAENQAPERPSRTERALAAVGAGGLTERVGADEDEPDEEPGEADEADDGDEEDEGGVLDRLAFWRADDEDDEAEPEATPDGEPAEAEAEAEEESEPDADEVAGDEDDEGGLLDAVAFWRSGDGDEADDEAATLAFWR